MKMSSSGKLTAIKLLHTGVWVFFNVVIFYLLYAVIVVKGRRTSTVDVVSRSDVRPPLKYQ